MAAKTSYPSYVVEAVAKLKEDLPFGIVLKKISGHYYVYKIGSEIDSRTGKRITTTDSYIGKITDGGKFVARSVRKGSDIDIAKAVIVSHGGKVWLPGEGHAEQLHASLNLSEIDLKILTNLTMNSRMPLSFMAKKLTIKESQLVSRVETLEKKLGIRYFPDVNTRLLGYLTFVAFVRFGGRMPNPVELKKDLQKDPHIMFASFCTGKYDLMIIMLAENEKDTAFSLRKIRSYPSISGLTSKWFVSYLYQTYGTLPLREEFFDLLQSKVWHRSKEIPHPLPNQITSAEYSVLKELNKSGKAHFTEIEERDDLPTGAAKRAYERLMERKVIQNNTMTMTAIHAGPDTLILMNKTNETALSDTRKNLLKFIISEGKKQATNRFCLVGDISVPDGVIFISASSAIHVAPGLDARLEAEVSGIKLQKLSLTDTLAGELCYARFDNRHSIQHQILVSEYNISEAQRESYTSEP